MINTQRISPNIMEATDLSLSDGVKSKRALLAAAPPSSPPLAHAWSIPAAWPQSSDGADDNNATSSSSRHEEARLLVEVPLTASEPYGDDVPLLSAEEAVELPCGSGAGGSAVAIARTLPSTAWDAASSSSSSGSSATATTSNLAARLAAELVARRNRFVCLQLATMAAQQQTRVTAARAARDTPALRHAAAVFLSTLEVDGALVAAAIHYPRARSKAAAAHGGQAAGAAAAGAAAAAQVDPLLACPHQYVELICTNAPGRGCGTALLKHVEAFAAAHAGALLAAALRGGGGGESGDDNTSTSSSNAMATSSSSTSLASSGATAASSPSTSSGSPSSRLRGVKLLAVESAAAFYAANGYAPPDAAREMFKPLF